MIIHGALLDMSKVNTTINKVTKSKDNKNDPYFIEMIHHDEKFRRPADEAAATRILVFCGGKDRRPL